MLIYAHKSALLYFILNHSPMQRDPSNSRRYWQSGAYCLCPTALHPTSASRSDDILLACAKNGGATSRASAQGLERPPVSETVGVTLPNS